jgi:hypothetical protein
MTKTVELQTMMREHQRKKENMEALRRIIRKMKSDSPGAMSLYSPLDWGDTKNKSITHPNFFFIIRGMRE